jgi:cytochrome c-type biogenesis protein CcmH/NrfG
MLSQPARSDHGRIQALIFLAAVLARYGRYGDSITVHDYLLDHVDLDPGTEYGLRLGRAMALLQEDRLFDADRAINELRRAAGDADSAGLALVEIFRDVKTGHPAEAVEIFNAKLTALRQQLGHRCADAWALVARAYDLLERPADAQTAYANATLLAPERELQRRYSEVAKLGGKYVASPAPPEMR